MQDSVEDRESPDIDAVLTLNLCLLLQQPLLFLNNLTDKQTILILNIQTNNTDLKYTNKQYWSYSKQTNNTDPKQTNKQYLNRQTNNTDPKQTNSVQYDHFRATEKFA